MHYTITLGKPLTLLAVAEEIYYRAGGREAPSFVINTQSPGTGVLVNEPTSKTPLFRIATEAEGNSRYARIMSALQAKTTTFAICPYAIHHATLERIVGEMTERDTSPAIPSAALLIGAQLLGKAILGKNYSKFGVEKMIRSYAQRK